MNYDCGLLKDLKMHSAISVHNCQRAYHLPLGKVSLQTAQTQKVRSARGSGITEDLSLVASCWQQREPAQSRRQRCRQKGRAAWPVPQRQLAATAWVFPLA